MTVVQCVATRPFSKDRKPHKSAVLTTFNFTGYDVQAWTIQIESMQQLKEIVVPPRRLPSDELLPDGRWRRRDGPRAIVEWKPHRTAEGGEQVAIVQIGVSTNDPTCLIDSDFCG